MSNYLQSRSKFLFVFITLSFNAQLSLADPATENGLYKHTHPTILQIRRDINKDYWAQANEQVKQLIKTVKNQPVVSKEDKSQNLNNPNLPMAIRDKISNFAKGFIYDPDNPGQFFDHLINGYTFLVDIEKQVIPYEEKFLGGKNPLVISSKAKYNEQLQYLEALKQQRVMLVKSKPRG